MQGQGHAPAVDRRPDPAWWREPTAAQWTNYLAAWAGWVLDGFDFSIFIFAMPDIAAEFHQQSYAPTALSITLTLLVRLAGGLGAGWLADRVGRRLPLMISIAWFALCDGGVAFAPTFGWVLLLRTLFGFGMGAEWTAGAALAMESWPERSRGLASGVLQGSWGLGYVLAAAAYGLVVPAHGWRALFLVAAVPALLVIPIRLFVKETRGEAAPALSPVPAPAPAATHPGPREPSLAARIVWACLLYGASFAVYYALVALWPTLLQKELHVAKAALFGPTVCFQAGMLAGAAVIGAAASRYGVVKAQVVPLLLLLPVLPLYVGAAGAGPGLWAGAFLAGLLGAGISGVTAYLFAGLFPPAVRARSFGIVYHVGALLSAFTPSFIAWRAKAASLPLSVPLAWTAAGAALLTIAILLVRPPGILPPEVLGKKTK